MKTTAKHNYMRKLKGYASLRYFFPELLDEYDRAVHRCGKARPSNHNLVKSERVWVKSILTTDKALHLHEVLPYAKSDS